MSGVSSRLIIKTHEQWSINNFYLKVAVIFKVVSSLDVCKKLFIFKKEVTPKSYREGVSLSSGKTRWSLYWKHYSIAMITVLKFFLKLHMVGHTLLHSVSLSVLRQNRSLLLTAKGGEATSTNRLNWVWTSLGIQATADGWKGVTHTAHATGTKTCTYQTGSTDIARTES